MITDRFLYVAVKKKKKKISNQVTKKEILFGTESHF